MPDVNNILYHNQQPGDSQRELNQGGITWWNVTFYGFIFLIYLVILILSLPKLGFKPLWFDEAGQFYIAKGLSHFTPVGASEGTFRDMLHYNSTNNLDPGGFSIILYFWMKIADNILWIRCLPALFTLLCSVFTALATYEVIRDRKVACLSGIIPFILVGWHFFELRAYAMELWGVAFGVWGIFWLKRRLSNKRILFYSIGLAIAITSRYSMTVFGAIFTLFILWDLFRRPIQNKQKWTYSICLITPLLIVLLILIFPMIMVQMPDQKLDYESYIGFSKFILCLWLLAAFVITIPYFKQSQNNRLLICLFWAINITFIVLGLLGKLPWQLGGRKGGPFMWFVLETVACCGCYLILKKKKTVLRYVCCILFFVFLLCYGRFGTMTAISADNKMIIYEKNYLNIKELPIVKHANRLHIGYMMWPEVKYLYEYGVLKDDKVLDGFPERFIIDSNMLNKQIIFKEEDYGKALQLEYLNGLPEGSLILESADWAVPKDTYMELSPAIWKKLER